LKYYATSWKVTGSSPDEVIEFFSRHYATSWKVAGSSPDEVIEFFSVYQFLPVTPLPQGLLSP
jgi:hypothetical protein